MDDSERAPLIGKRLLLALLIAALMAVAYLLYAKGTVAAVYFQSAGNSWTGQIFYNAFGDVLKADVQQAPCAPDDTLADGGPITIRKMNDDGTEVRGACGWIRNLK